MLFASVAATAVICCYLLFRLTRNSLRPPQINDALLRTLDAEREGTPIAVEDGEGDSGKGAPSLLDLDGGTEDPFVGKVSFILSYFHSMTSIL